MPRIEIQTVIKANIRVVFDLTRSIDLHKLSTGKTNEEAISGRTAGLIGLGESVTWRAKHFGIYQKLTSKVTDFDMPNYFVDEMVKGAFKSFRHEHHFREMEIGTLMIDVFQYRSPLGFIGQIADKLFLENYMKKFLSERNQVIKEIAESDRWKAILNS